MTTTSRERREAAARSLTDLLDIDFDADETEQAEAYLVVDAIAGTLLPDRAACMALIRRAGLPVPPKSSCTFCPFQKISQWQHLRKEQPERFQQAVDLEQAMIERRARLGKDPVYLTGTARPLAEVVVETGQLDIFEDGATCDIGGYCYA